MASGATNIRTQHAIESYLRPHTIENYFQLTASIISDSSPEPPKQQLRESSNEEQTQRERGEGGRHQLQPGPPQLAGKQQHHPTSAK
jgi:hypothetical protein